MTKKAYGKIAKGLEEAIAFAEGHTAGAQVHAPADVDVKAIRKAMNLTQDEFGARFGFGKANVRDWEQGRTKPSAAARTLLLVIAREPEAVDRALTRDRQFESA